ncbi:MAG: hypothetical protein AB7L94_14820, partial [Kofleriaceae bacterium]
MSQRLHDRGEFFFAKRKEISPSDLPFSPSPCRFFLTSERAGTADESQTDRPPRARWQTIAPLAFGLADDRRASIVGHSMSRIRTRALDSQKIDREK